MLLKTSGAGDGYILVENGTCTFRSILCNACVHILQKSKKSSKDALEDIENVSQYFKMVGVY